jgi:hypothetical protein
MKTLINSSKKIIAFTDSVNECDCCGKKGLKGTFCVEIEGNEFYFGSTCAFKKHGFEKLFDYKLALKNYERLLYARRKGFLTIEEMEIDNERVSKLIENWANKNN